MKCIDIMLVKQLVKAGKLATKIDMFGNILLEDTLSGEAAKIGKLPDGYSFHRNGKWQPGVSYPYSSIENHTKCIEGWTCSECGEFVEERSDWCICGADMRGYNNFSKELKELVEVL